jgi:hypothetical protein
MNVNYPEYLALSTNWRTEKAVLGNYPERWLNPEL